MSTAALTEKNVPFFCIFGLGVFAVSGFLPFLRGMRKHTKKQNLKKNNRKGNKTTRCKQENHLVWLQKGKRRQHRHKTIQINDLKQKQKSTDTKETAKMKATWVSKREC